MRALIKDTLLSLGIIILANMAMYSISYWSGTERQVVNLDYFISFLFLALRNRFLFILAFILAFIFDFLVIFSQIFPFIRIVDLAYLLKFSLISSNSYKVYGLLLIFTLTLQIIILYRIYDKKLNINILTLFNICIVMYAIDVNVKESNGKFWKPDEGRFSASQMINYIESRNRGFIKTYSLEGDAIQDTLVKGATSSFPKTDKFFLIVNESWGVTIDKKIQKSILSSIVSKSYVKSVELDSLEFEGFTIAGELRELCGKVSKHFNLKKQYTGFEDCLPNKFKEKGYQTIAVHGALGLMYDRKDWYPRAGFQKMYFRDSELNLPNSRCYSFPGNCDRDIAPKITNEFLLNDKLFLYWLTLNTHSIYDKRDLVVDLFDCSEYQIEEDTASCRNLKLQAQFFYTLSKMLESSAFNGAYVIVVGDHSPPIIEEETKTVFQRNEVPVLRFNVKHEK